MDTDTEESQPCDDGGRERVMHPLAKEGQGLLTKPKLEEAEHSLQGECSPVHLDLYFWI